MNIAITQREITIRGWTYDCTQQDWFDFLGQHTLWTIPNNAPFNLTEADCLFVSGGTGSERRIVLSLWLYNYLLTSQLLEYVMEHFL